MADIDPRRLAHPPPRGRLAEDAGEGSLSSVTLKEIVSAPLPAADTEPDAGEMLATAGAASSTTMLSVDVDPTFPEKSTPEKLRTCTPVVVNPGNFRRGDINLKIQSPIRSVPAAPIYAPVQIPVPA